MKYEIKNFVDYYTRQSIELNLAHNCRYSSYDFVRMCIDASLGNDSIEGVDLKNKYIGSTFPSSDTTMYQLKSKRHNVKYYLDVFDRLNRSIFQMAKRKGLLKKPVKVAIDYHDIPYFGNKNDPYVRGVKDRRGTKWGFTFASINIVSKGQRFCLKVLPITLGTKTSEIVRKLLEFALKVVDIKLVLADRWFSNDVNVIKVIESFNLKWLMAVQTKVDTSQVMFGLSDGQRIFDYRMGNKRNNVSFTYFLIDSPKKKGEFYHYATNLRITEFNKKRVGEMYRKRWGIETGYRMVDDFKIKTCAKSYKIRLFDYLLSSSVYNLWVLWNIIDKSKDLRSGEHITTKNFKFLILDVARYGMNNVRCFG